MDVSQFERPDRGESIQQTMAQVPARKEVPRDIPAVVESPSQASVGYQELSSTKAPSSNLAVGGLDGVPARSPRRPLSSQAPLTSLKEQTATTQQTFTAPRDPPPVPAEPRHKQNASVTSIQSDYSDTRMPSSPNRLPGEHFADLSSRGDEEEAETPGLLRKMSKAVRHGRSHSDKVGSASPKWPSRGSRNASVDIKAADISSPISAGHGEGEGVDLRNKLRYSQQRIAELEAEKLALHEKFNGIEDIRQVNSELRQKRSTVAMLDTQREIVIRELEIMTEQLQKAKSSNEPLDVNKLQSIVLRDLAQQMANLRETLFKDIETLISRKNDLTNEISSLIQMKDKGFQEYESLTTKNHQLAEHNNQLVQSIQDLYRQGKQPQTPGFASTPGPSANGLGIYSQHNKAPSAEHLEVMNRQQYDAASQISNDGDGEAATVVGAPQIVNLRKAQPKKFLNWKKGRDAVKQNVSKGFKGAFGSTQERNEEPSFQEGGAYSSMQQGDAPLTGEKPLTPARLGPTPMTQAGTIEQGRGAWLRGRDIPGSKSSVSSSFASGTTLRPSESGTSTATSTIPRQSTPPDAGTTLFGSDLSQRCEYEKSVVPHLVISCINEVSSRGIDQEGIYRKSGSSTQVKAVQQGFETSKTGDASDISDPDLDIHAITGCLKQYLRRLPNPLITFECYDALLDCMRHEGEDGVTRAKRLRAVVDELPKSHRETLEFLLFHLTKVMEQQSVNLVSSTPFPPSAFRIVLHREVSSFLH